MEWLKKHVDTVIVLGAIFGSFLWMNTEFNNIDKEIAAIRTEMAVMKTVLIMKDVMPKTLASKIEEDK